MSEKYDVLVVGGGNAALCAAISAREAGARVMVLERSPENERGGNTRHTRNIRCTHAAADQFFSGPYSEQEHLQDLIGVTGGPANLDLAKLAVRESSQLPAWMSGHGVHWQQPLAGTLHLGRTNRWFLGGGKAMLNTYYREAARMEIDVRYNARVEELIIENSRFDAVRLAHANGGAGEIVRAGAVVVAAGGYEANIEWLKRHWGDAADNFIIRGSAYNDGQLLAALMKCGAKSMGDPKGFHAIAVDARAPKFDGGIVTRLDVVPFGIVVNRDARRFYDEGQDIWPKRYAIWGTLIAGQPGQIAYGIVDAKAIDRFLPPMFKPYKADTLEALAPQLGLDSRTFVETVTEYNRAAAANTEIHMERLDGVGTQGLTPPKSNWALPIDRAPFYGLPLRPGITFTYMGVAVDECARVLDQSGRPFQNVHAAGEIMSGNILTKGYLGGFGLTIGSVFGRIAGREAASNARA
ncbi:MAG: FAD-dependent tricarballylate dehydrogenase TcuA [Acidobacteriia bacterium]|nr:FAD-dependent tricarballylate dehydrogenase TcuA [Terriglobia bacterium]